LTDDVVVNELRRAKPGSEQREYPSRRVLRLRAKNFHDHLLATITRDAYPTTLPPAVRLQRSKRFQADDSVQLVSIPDFAGGERRNSIVKIAKLLDVDWRNNVGADREDLRQFDELGPSGDCSRQLPALA
jgi:hypothetical protein